MWWARSLCICLQGSGGHWPWRFITTTGGRRSQVSLAYALFTVGLSALLWLVLKAAMGIRVGEEEEIQGLDTTELGMEAYPDFTKG